MMSTNGSDKKSQLQVVLIQSALTHKHLQNIEAIVTFAELLSWLLKTISVPNNTVASSGMLLA